MGMYYLDIETSGSKQDECEILTIQWQKLERNTGNAIGELHILKKWESSEKDILEKFSDTVNQLDSNGSNFIPVGYGLKSEHDILSDRSTKLHTEPVDIMHKPQIDLHQLSILINQGKFIGTKLNDMTNKSSDGSVIPEYYKNKDYKKIIEYIEEETYQCIEFLKWAFLHVPTLETELRKRFPK